MRKCWKKLILFALILFATVVVGKGNVKAATIIDSGSCGDNATYTLDSDGVLTISGSGEIAENAFRNWVYPSYTYASKIETVTIQQGITSIGNDAFEYCINLNSITIPEGMTDIGDWAFGGCTSLTDITFPETLTRIGYSAFVRCGPMESIYIPKNVEYIGELAFVNIKSSIVVADENTYYNSKNNCNAIIETATNKLIIGCGATIIPNDVTQIARYAFEGCSELSNITIPENVTDIGDNAFLNCSNLANVKISEGVMSIGDGAFCGCSSLTSITIPESVTWIGWNAFGNCGQIESLYIPKKVKHIGRGAFTNIKSSIIVANENTYYNSKNDCNAIIETATNKLITGCGNTVIPDDVTQIDYGTFNGCTNLKAIIIPKSVTKIGDYAFRGCSNLENITIPEGVTEIGEYAFGDCSNLNDVTISRSVTNIKEGAFWGCVSLTNIAIPESVTEIGESTFENCSNLANVTIPENVTEIRDWTFYGCSSLLDITIPKSVTSIGDYSFGENDKLKSITILNPNAVIDNAAFANVNENCIIYGYTGSTAEAYATEYGLTFKVIGSSDDSNNNGNTGSDASNSGAGVSGAGSGSGSGAAAGGSAAQPSGSGSTGVTGATGSASNSETSSTMETGTTTSKIKLTTKNTTIKLSKTSYTYDGKAKKPTVKVLNSKGKVLKSSNYTVKYSNNVKAGKATVTIKFKGKYTGTIKATYTIKPKTTAITGATRNGSNGSKVALIWKKQAAQTSGYQIQYATDKKFTKDKQLVTVSSAKKTSKTIKNVSEDKSYYFRVRTYKEVNGKKVYSVWSKSKIVKTEK